MPKVVTNKMLKEREAEAERKKKEAAERLTVEYTCMVCCEEKREEEFYKSANSRVWNYSSGRVLFCRECIDELMKNIAESFDQKTALMAICALLDIPFLLDVYESNIVKNGSFMLGNYVRMLNGTQYRKKTFITSLVDGEFAKTDDQLVEERETRWSRKDIQNKKYAIAVCGYDPFEDVYLTEDDRKYCFNILAGYCDAEGIKNDGHKIQCVIELTLLYLQCFKLNQMINQALLELAPDEKTIKSLSETKTKLLSSIAKLAEDNNISSKFSTRSKQGANTLTQKMKEMMELGYDDVYVNMFDVRTSAAMKQIADLSHQSIMESLSWDLNDYAEMVKEQREMIVRLQNTNDQLAEENRLMNNRIEELTGKKKVG